MKKLIFPVVIVALLSWIFIDKCNYSNLSDDFKAKQDSLVQTVDSLQVEIAKSDSVINDLNILDAELNYQLMHQKNKIKKVVKYVEVEKNKIDTYSEAELVSSFNTRYPTDTVTNPLPLAEPVLTSIAKDLVEFDGAKIELGIKDNIIVLNEERIANKDSVIALQVKKELNYNNIVVNQEMQIKDWRFQYNKAQLENHKLRIKNKFTKIAAGVVIGGLTYMILSK
jgi:SMC interacting uncharacterized protein involved in chromosome segregation